MNRSIAIFKREANKLKMSCAKSNDTDKHAGPSGIEDIDVLLGVFGPEFSVASSGGTERQKKKKAG